MFTSQWKHPPSGKWMAVNCVICKNKLLAIVNLRPYRIMTVCFQCCLISLKLTCNSISIKSLFIESGLVADLLRCEHSFNNLVSHNPSVRCPTPMSSTDNGLGARQCSAPWARWGSGSWRRHCWRSELRAGERIWEVNIGQHGQAKESTESNCNMPNMLQPGHCSRVEVGTAWTSVESSSQAFNKNSGLNSERLGRGQIHSLLHHHWKKLALWHSSLWWKQEDIMIGRKQFYITFFLVGIGAFQIRKPR